jgi:cytochrome c-type biogenesis protein CcmF
LTLYAWRAPGLDSEAGFRLLSRETFLLLNNVLLVIATALILGGTLAPLFVELFTGGKISVGPPYFEIAFAIPMLPLVLLIGLGMHTAWRSQDAGPLMQVLKKPALIAVVLGLVIPLVFYGSASVLVVVGVITAIWIMMVAIIPPLRSWRRASGSAAITRGALGMSIAHFGVGLFVLGVTIVSAYTVEADRSLRIGDVQQSPMTEAGIDAAWNRDIFVALGDPLGNDAWSVRLQYKPMIRFIWLGAFIMALGGIVAASDRRYRLTAREKQGKEAAMSGEPA